VYYLPHVSYLRSRVEAALAAALSGLLVYSLWRLALKAYAYLHSPYSRDYGEGCVLMMVQLLDARGTYFLSLRDYPFVHANYPPVFIALVWPFYHWLGPSLFAPRLLSTIATVGLLAVLYALARRLGVGATRAAAVAALAACPWFFQTWAAMGRVDMLAFLLSIAGLLVFVGEGPAALAFPLFWLAFFTKQSALVAPAAILLHVMLDGDWRRFARVAAGFVLPLVGLFLAGNLATHGELFRHLVTYTAAAQYEWDRMLDSYFEFARIAWPLLLVIVGAVAAAPDAFARGAGRLMLIYWLLNMVALATIAKAGAAQNYYIEPWLSTVLLAAVALPIVAARAPTPEGWATGALLVAALSAHFSSNWAHHLPQAIMHPERAADFRELWDTVRKTDGDMLSENLAALVVNGKPVLVEPHGIMLLARTGVFDPAPIVRDCDRGRFRLVVAERRFEETPGLGECLERKYRAESTLGPYRLLRPRQ
jgi:hypothetical protein